MMKTVGGTSLAVMDAHIWAKDVFKLSIDLTT